MAIPSKEVAVPTFDPTQAFEEVATPRFDPSKPFEEVEPAIVSRMADATRATVGVVGRAISAFDLAQLGAQAVDPSVNAGALPQDRNPAQENPTLFPSKPSENPYAVLMTPLVPLRKAFGIGEQISNLGNVSTGPGITAFKPGQVQATVGGVVSGLEDVAGGAMEFMTSPVGIATLGLGAAPGAIRGVASSVFAADMLSHTPESLREFQAATTPEEKARALTKGIGNLTMAGVAGAHGYGELYRAIKPEVKLQITAPLTAEAVAKVNPEPTPELKPGDILPQTATTTPLTAQAVAAVEKGPNAVPVQIANEEMLRQPQPEVGLPQVGEGNAKSQEPSRTQEAASIGGAKVEVAKEPVLETPAPTPAAAAGESGTPPVTAGVPPAKESVARPAEAAKTESEQTLTTEPGGRVTGIKNAAVDAERQARGQPPLLGPARLANPVVWDRAMSRIESDPEWQDRLIDELKDKPRTPSADEIVALDHRYVDLQNEFAKATADGDAAFKSGDANGVEEAKTRTAFLESKLAELEQVARHVGTEWGRSGQMRQRLIREDFTLAAMEARARAAKGFEPLTETEHAEIASLHEKLSAQEKAASEAEAAASERIAMLEAQKALAEAKAAAVPEYPASVLTHAQRFVDFMHKKGDAARARIRERMSRTSAAVDPTVLADAAIIGAEHLSAKALDIAKFTEVLVKDLGEWVREHAQEIFEASKKALTDSEKSFFKGTSEASKKRVKRAAQTSPAADRASIVEGLKEAVAEGAESSDIGRYARKIAEGFIKEGVTELEALTDAVHGVLKEVLPEITRTESRDAWTQYGKYKPLNPDPVKVRLRELSTEGQKVSTIERLEKGLAGLKTWSERQPPTDKARRLQKQINELKKKLGIVTTDPARQLRSALDAIKTRNRNRIADLRFENSTRTRIVKNKRVAMTDDEVVAQRAEIAELQKQNEEIFGGKDLTDAQRLARAISAAERAEAAGEATLSRAEKGDFSKPATKGFPASATLDEIRARTAAYREETKALKDLANPKKTPEEKAMSALKARIARDTADFTRRIAEGDFSPRRKPPREITLDPATATARAEVEALKSKFAQLLERKQYQQKTRLEKIWHGIKKTGGVFVNLVSSFDFSAPRQAFFSLLSNMNRLMLPFEVARDASGTTRVSYRNQLESAKMVLRSFGRMFQSWTGEKTAGRIEQQRKARANAVSGADKEAGIHYAELNSHTFTKYEENAHSLLDEWAQLPFKTGNLAKTVATAPAKAVARGVRASNRAFVTFLNSTRAELFDELLRVNYQDRAPTASELKIIGNAVNIATGRGALNPKVASVASAGVWAPYLLASRVQAVVGQPLWTGKWADSSRARGIVAKEYARAIISGYLLLQTSRMFSDKDERNMTSSDYAKTVRGNTRIDPWGGLQQVTTLGARIISGKTTSLKGKDRDVTASRKYGVEGLFHILADFGRSKLRPDVGTVIDIITRETGPLHKKTTPKTVAENLLVPLPMRDIVEIMKEHGFTEGMIIEALGQFGAGVSQFEHSAAQK